MTSIYLVDFIHSDWIQPFSCTPRYFIRILCQELSGGVKQCCTCHALACQPKHSRIVRSDAQHFTSSTIAVEEGIALDRPPSLKCQTSIPFHTNTNRIFARQKYVIISCQMVIYCGACRTSPNANKSKKKSCSTRKTHEAFWGRIECRMWFRQTWWQWQWWNKKLSYEEYLAQMHTSKNNIMVNDDCRNVGQDESRAVRFMYEDFGLLSLELRVLITDSSDILSK